ncbi:MAG TPA: DUF86 domain-containing protein [Candidatus Paceibacterota bacterium]
MVINAPLDQNKLETIIIDIEASIRELTVLAKLPAEDLARDRKNYALAEYYFRRALEGILTAGTYLVSRLPAKTRNYRDILIALGQHKIVPPEFAERNKDLADYRNRLVHLYWEITPIEIHRIINEHLKDLNDFCGYFKQVLARPQDFNLTLE